MTVEEAIKILEYSNEMLKEQIAALKSGQTLLDEVDKSAYQTIEYCQSEYAATELAVEALREKQERESKRAQPENEQLTRCENCQNWDKSKSWSLLPGAHACTFWSPSQYEPRYTGGFEFCSFAKTKPERSDSDA